MFPEACRCNLPASIAVDTACVYEEIAFGVFRQALGDLSHGWLLDASGRHVRFLLSWARAGGVSSA
jgi:hypothetical protein